MRWMPRARPPHPAMRRSPIARERRCATRLKRAMRHAWTRPRIGPLRHWWSVSARARSKAAFGPSWSPPNASFLVRRRRVGIEQLLALELAPQLDRDLDRQARHVLLDLGHAESAGDHRAQRGMEQRELHRRRAQLDAVAAAYRLDLLCLLDEGRGGGDVIVGGAGLHAAGQNAGVVRSAQDHRDVALETLGQELGEPALFEQRVAAGEQHAVEVTCLDKAQAGVGFVDADAYGADDACLAQLVERLVAAVHHRLERPL